MRSSQWSENWEKEEEIKNEQLKPSSKNKFRKLHVNTCTFQNFNLLFTNTIIAQILTYTPGCKQHPTLRLPARPSSRNYATWKFWLAQTARPGKFKVPSGQGSY